VHVLHGVVCHVWLGMTTDSVCVQNKEKGRR